MHIPCNLVFYYLISAFKLCTNFQGLWSNQSSLPINTLVYKLLLSPNAHEWSPSYMLQSLGNGIFSHLRGVTADKG